MPEDMCTYQREAGGKKEKVFLNGAALQPSSLHFSILSRFGACMHMYLEFFKALGLRFELWLAMGDVVPTTR